MSFRKYKSTGKKSCCWKSWEQKVYSIPVLVLWKHGSFPCPFTGRYSHRQLHRAPPASPGAGKHAWAAEKSRSPPSCAEVAWLQLPWPGYLHPLLLPGTGRPCRCVPTMLKWNLKCHMQKGHLRSDCDKYSRKKEEKKKQAKKRKTSWSWLLHHQSNSTYPRRSSEPYSDREETFQSDLTIKSIHLVICSKVMHFLSFPWDIFFFFWQGQKFSLHHETDN